MDGLQPLFDMIHDLRAENQVTTQKIFDKLDALSAQVVEVRLWRARITGMVAVVSVAISAAAWGIANAFGG